MSTIFNQHTAQVYDAKKDKAFPNQRLVVTIAKKDKDGNYGQYLQQTMATSIPILTRGDVDFTLASVQDICIDYLKSVQNEIIAGIIKSGNKTINDNQIDSNAIVDYLASDSTGDKWTSERIAQWFNDNLAEPIATKLMEAGFADEVMETKLQAANKRFSEALASKARINGKLQVELNKIIGFAADKSDTVYKKFHAKINPPIVDKIDLEDSLGF